MSCLQCSTLRNWSRRPEECNIKCVSHPQKVQLLFYVYQGWKSSNNCKSRTWWFGTVSYQQEAVSASPASPLPPPRLSAAAVPLTAPQCLCEWKSVTASTYPQQINTNVKQRHLFPSTTVNTAACLRSTQLLSYGYFFFSYTGFIRFICVFQMFQRTDYKTRHIKDNVHRHVLQTFCIQS